jgi:NO-binding membrane sensor protein with MHYT domain
MEELVFKPAYKKFEKSILIASGLILGLAIWAMHFVGMLASHLPEGYHFDLSLTALSYLVGAVASIFAVWLTTRPTLPLPRLVLGAIYGLRHFRNALHGNACTLIYRSSTTL